MKDPTTVSNIRKKSISTWMRVWEVLCPDCLEYRGLKTQHYLGLTIARCQSCAAIKRRRDSGRSKFTRGWQWLGQDISRRKIAIPFLWCCVGCGKPPISEKHHVFEKKWTWKCKSCAMKHIRSCKKWK